MKFKSQVITQASGSVGGVTYAHNRGGLYQRARSIPVNTNTPAQQAARLGLTTATQAWSQVLTQAQREQWADYAANTPVTDVFGDPLLLSGQQMYVRCNSARLRAGLARVDAGPSVYGLPDTGDISFEGNNITPNGLRVLYDNTAGWATEDGGGLILQTSRFQSPGINFLRSPFRFWAVVDGDGTTPPASPFDSSTNAYGMDPVDHLDDAIFLRARATRADGRLGPVVELRITVEQT